MREHTQRVPGPLEFDPKSIVSKKPMTNDYEIHVEIRNKSLWVVRVRNLQEVRMGLVAWCSFAYASTDSDATNNYHTHILCTTTEKLQRAVEIAEEWIINMHNAKMEAEAILEGFISVGDWFEAP